MTTKRFVWMPGSLNSIESARICENVRIHFNIKQLNSIFWYLNFLCNNTVRNEWHIFFHYWYVIHICISGQMNDIIWISNRINKTTCAVSKLFWWQIIDNLRLTILHLLKKYHINTSFSYFIKRLILPLIL